MPNGGPPDSHLMRKQPLAPWQRCRGKGFLEGEFAGPFPWFSASAPGLKLPPILHCRQSFWACWWGTVLSSKVAFQSCPFWRQVTQAIATTSSDIFAWLSSPSSVCIMAIDVIGYEWTWQVPTMLTTCRYFYSNKAFALFPRMQIHHVSPCSGRWKISGPCSKRLSRWRMGGDSNSSAKAENERKGR